MFRNIFGKTAPCGELNRFIGMLGFTTVCLLLLAFINVQRVDAATLRGSAALEHLLNPNDVLGTDAARVLGRAPYGGCKEASQPGMSHTRAAADCRRHGWVIRPRIVVGPHGVLRYSALPKCRFEDGSGQRSACSWNFGWTAHEAGPGSTLWNDRRNRAHYVWPSSPANHGWRWVTSEQADVLAESMVSDAGTRRWEQCVIKIGATTVVACPDGESVTS